LVETYFLHVNSENYLTPGNMDLNIYD
jgi:hypothetical protein